MLVITKPVEPLVAMLREYFRLEMVNGSTNKAAELALHSRRGRERAAAECIAAELTKRRADALTFFHKEIPAIASWDVEKVLEPLSEAYRSPEADRNSKLFEELVNIAYDKITDLILTDDLFEQNTALRRAAIERGEAKPLPEDVDYFDERAKAFEELAKGYRKLVLEGANSDADDEAEAPV